MKYFYVISNLSKDYVLDVQDEVQSCLEKRGAVCRYMTDYERMKNGRHTAGISPCLGSTGDIWAF